MSSLIGTTSISDAGTTITGAISNLAKSTDLNRLVTVSLAASSIATIVSSIEMKKRGKIIQFRITATPTVAGFNDALDDIPSSVIPMYLPMTETNGSTTSSFVGVYTDHKCKIYCNSADRNK